MTDIKVIGQMDGPFESSNRVYDVGGWHQRLTRAKVVKENRKFYKRARYVWREQMRARR